jgi:outer membrane protein
MKFVTLAVAAAAVIGSSAALAQQAEGNWMMRIRAVDIQPIKKSDPIPALGLSSNAVWVDSKLIPEVDFTYFFSKNLAAELILTYPQKLDVQVNGVGRVGKFNALPPTLTFQYHFAPEATFRPYVGAGINYTIISSIDLPVVNALTGSSSTLSKSSVGGALQIGFDYKIGKNSYLNFDIKKTYINADLSVGGTKVSRVTLDPVLIGIGYGFRF